MRPIFAIVTSVIIVVLGLLSIRELPVEQYPNITPPVVEVSASYQGADAMNVSQGVATPLAQSIMGVENMLYMQSTSANDGSMSLSVTFDVGTDPDMSSILTQNRTQSSEPMLPTVVKEQGVMVQKSMNSFLLVIAMYSDGRYNGDFMANYAELNVKNEILKINGVGKVEVMGAAPYSMRIWVEPDKMNYLNISIDDIVAALESQSGIFPAGKLGASPAAQGTQFTYTVVLPAAISTPEQYGNVVLRNLSNGQQVLLSDVARVELGSQSYGMSALFGKKPAAILAVYQSPGSNALEVGNSVKSRMQELSNDFVDGVSYETVVDTTTVISEGMTEILITLVIALVLVLLIIYLFLQDFRAMVVPLVAIPVSLIGAFMLFPLLGFTINVFSMLGLVLAIGLVVDDAIVVVEAVQVGLEAGMSPALAVRAAMGKVRRAIIATTLVLAAVFIPVCFMAGITGLLYRQFAITIALSVLISAFNALTLSPALCSIWLRPRVRNTTGFFGWFNRTFDRGIGAYLHREGMMVGHAVRSFVFVVVVAAALGWLSYSLPGGFLPAQDQGFLMTSVSLPEAASLERTEQVASEVADLIARDPGVENITSVSGFDMLAGINSSNTAILFIKLKPYSQRAGATEIADRLTGMLYVEENRATAFTFGPPAIPGVGTSSGFSMMIQDDGSGTQAYLGENLNKFIAEASKRPEISQVYSSFNNNIPQRKLTVDQNAAMTAGVSMDEIHKVITTFMAGMYVNNFNRFGQLYQTYIQADAPYRQREEDLSLFFVTNAQGKSVPLSAFVTMSDTTGVEYITGYNLHNAAAVMGSAAPGYSSAQAMDALEEVAEQVLPRDMSYAWSGMSLQEQQAAGSAIWSYLSVLLFVYLVLAALYESWTMPLIVLLGVPLALFGAMSFSWVAHLFSDVYINDIFMQISMVMLIGLSAKNAILIVEYARDEFQAGSTLAQAAISAVKQRTRPVLMTAMAFLLGIMPLIFATGSGASERMVMGLALFGGMCVATVMGLVVYPMLYVAVGRLGKFDAKRQRAQQLKAELENQK